MIFQNVKEALKQLNE